MRSFRLFVFCISIALILSGSLLTPSALGQREFVEEVAGKYFRLAGLADFFVGHLLGKGVDAVWDKITGKPDTIELKSRLESLEKSLTSLDERSAAEIAALRRSVDERTTREEVERIVNRVKQRLDARINRVDGRVDNLEDRVTKIEQLWAFLPDDSASPVFRSAGLEARPRAHPLVAQWLGLLCRSESNRQRLVRERRRQNESAPEVATLIQEQAAILEETAGLHFNVNKRTAELLAVRSTLIKTMDLQDREVMTVDEELASLVPLVRLTKPLESGRASGRLGVPTLLLSPSATSIISAFAQSGGDPKSLVPLYIQLIPKRPSPVLPAANFDGHQTPAIRKAVYITNMIPTVVLGAREDRGRLNAAIDQFGSGAPAVQGQQEGKQRSVKNLIDGEIIASKHLKSVHASMLLCFNPTSLQRPICLNIGIRS